MLECSVCGLLFTATDTCPSCGSTIAEEINPVGMVGCVVVSRGLDDLAQTVGDDELEVNIQAKSTRFKSTIWARCRIINHQIFIAIWNW